MNRLTLAALICMTTAANAAEPVTLTIENDAGMVTTVSGLTQRECDAATVLMQPGKDSVWHAYSATITLGAPGGPSASDWMKAGQPIPPQPHTSRLTSARCSVPATEK